MITLKTIINAYSTEDPYALENWNKRIRTALPHIFDFDYPVHNDDEDIKEKIEVGIMKRYYRRQVEGSTVQEFKNDLDRFLNERMPYYNQLLALEDLTFNPFDTIDYKEVMDRKVKSKTNDKVLSENTQTSKTDIDRTTGFKGSSTNDSTDGYKGSQVSNDNGQDVKLSTPMGIVNINDIDYQHASESNVMKNKNDVTDSNERNIKGSNISSTETKDKSNGNENSTLKGDSKRDKEDDKQEDYILTKKGKTGNDSFSKLILEYRKAIFNVIEEIIDEADECFYQLYDY